MHGHGSLRLWYATYARRQADGQFILLSPCAFLAEIDILLPKLAVEMQAEDCIFLNLRAFKICFILMDVICVLAQLAGTALTITFGDLVQIGQKVSL
jgi:hypothetical protein